MLYKPSRNVQNYISDQKFKYFVRHSRTLTLIALCSTSRATGKP